MITTLLSETSPIRISHVTDPAIHKGSLSEGYVDYVGVLINSYITVHIYLLALFINPSIFLVQTIDALLSVLAPSFLHLLT